MRRSGLSATAAAIVAVLGITMLTGCGRRGIEPIVWLPKTGQTVSYATGDDGDIQAGIDWPDPRFTNNGDGTITDNLTGLMWDQSGLSTTNYWADALTDVDGMSIGSHTDWRVPNMVELRSLWNAGQASPATWLNSAGFSSFYSGSYFSSTVYAPLDSYVWGITFASGNGYAYQATGTTRPVVAVRAEAAGEIGGLPRTGQTASVASGDDGDLELGASWPNPRFVDNEDGTITDLVTGLVWEQDGASEMRWDAALAEINDMTLAGHDDWRLPNILELLSLVNSGEEVVQTWLQTNGFTGIQTQNYWSSTTDAGDTAYAWLVSFADGDRPASENKSSIYAAIAVRGPDATP